MLKWGLAIVDISSAFTQSHMMQPSERCILLMPWYVPCPWRGTLCLDKSASSPVTYGLLTIRPLYGTSCAPLRWFACISEEFRRRNWTQLPTDPCLFRFSAQNQLVALAALHVDDILVGCHPDHWSAFESVISGFRHSGLNHLSPGSSAVYLGLDLHILKDQIHLSQQTFIETRLIKVSVQDLYTHKGCMVSIDRRKTIAKQLIGSVLWMTHTRIDLHCRISMMASTITSSILSETSFLIWVKRGVKLLDSIRNSPRKIAYRSPLSWVPNSSVEIASRLKLFAFSDASHGGLDRFESMECCILILGAARARNGEILCCGGIIDANARKILRICRSSLSAESIALCNCSDLAIWSRILILEITFGKFFPELVNNSRAYSLVTPFGSPPSFSEIIAELNNELPKLTTTESNEQLNEQLYGLESKKCILENWIKTLVLTDSANAYSCILSGNPKCQERQVRLTLAVVRDLSQLLVLSFIDKDYNLSDCGTKDERSNKSILLSFLDSSYFKIGFLGRSELLRRKAEAMKATLSTQKK